MKDQIRNEIKGDNATLDAVKEQINNEIKGGNSTIDDVQNQIKEMKGNGGNK